MIKEFWQDIKAFGGLPIYLFVTLLFLVMRDYYGFFVLALGLLLSYIVTVVVRLAYFRPRPQKVKYKNWIQKLEASSFPSLHTIRIVVLGIMLMVTIRMPTFSMLMIPYMILAAYARVKLKRHHLSDIFGGVAFGVMIVLLSFWIGNLLF